MPLHRSRLKMSVIFHQKFEDFSSKFRNFANVHLNFFVFLTDFDENFSGFHQIYRKFQKSLKLLHRNSKFGVIAYILPTFYLHFRELLVQLAAQIAAQLAVDQKRSKNFGIAWSSFSNLPADHSPQPQAEDPANRRISEVVPEAPPLKKCKT